MSYAIQTNRLTKVINGKEIVSDVSIKVKKGEVYSILGPNGAGKTTLMRMLLNLVRPSGGDVELNGKLLKPGLVDVFKRVGSIIEYPVLYERMTARGNLELHCDYMGFYDRDAIQQALKLVGLDHASDQEVKGFSLGMKQRLGIARAIVTRPEILILDEPINGLDPIGIKEMRNLFQKLSSEYGMTLFIASHILGEIEQIADTVGILHHGKLIKEVSMDEIKNQHTEYYELRSNDVKKACYVLEHQLGILNFRVMDNKIVRIYDSSLEQSELAKQLVLQDVNVESFTKHAVSLEEYFLDLVGTEKNDSPASLFA